MINKIKKYLPFEIKYYINFVKNIFNSQYQETDMILRKINDVYGKKFLGVYIDIGAHYGNIALPFIKKKWDSYLFEPSFNNRRFLHKKLSKFSNVKIYPFAISNKISKSIFYESYISTGISSLNKFDKSHKKSSIVTTVDFDLMAKILHINKIDLLKIDVEGHEKSVLDGFDNVNKIKPKVIICEFDDSKQKNNETSAISLVNWFVANKYKPFYSIWSKASSYGGNHKYVELSDKIPNFSEKTLWGNIIAVDLNQEPLIRSLKKDLS